MVSIAETKEYFSLLAVDVFKQNYVRYSLQIQDPFRHAFVGDNDTRLNRNLVNYKVVSGQKLVINHYRTILNVLKHFGHIVSKLHITYTSTYEEMDITEISKFVNVYCCETLTELYIDSFQMNFFENMPNPFKVLTKLSIKGEFQAFDGQLKIEELFPVVHDLTLLPIFIPNGAAIHRRFSNLEILHVHIWQMKNSLRFTQDDVEALLRKNPQIRCVRFNYCTRPFLKTVNKILPNLVQLEIDNYRNVHGDDGLPIVFEYVNYLALRGGAESVPRNLFFSRIEELYTDMFPRNCFKWIDFVQNCTTLKKLIVCGPFVTNEQLEHLAEHTLNLDEVHIQLNNDVNDATISEFVRTSGNIEKILFSWQKKTNSFQLIAAMIGQNSECKWRITETPYEMLLEKID